MTHNTLIIHPKSPTLALHISRTTDRIGKFESANEIATSQSVERNYETNGNGNGNGNGVTVTKQVDVIGLLVRLCVS